jgi:hypothetical protein
LWSIPHPNGSIFLKFSAHITGTETGCRQYFGKEKPNAATRGREL